ncbi:MAG: glycosyltransferase [Phormidesmis sp.]
MIDNSTAKVAWLVPSVVAGGYFGPVLTETAAFFAESIFFTGEAWPDAGKTDFGKAKIKIVGRTGFVKLQSNDGYGRNLILASPAIVPELVRYRPDLIIANGFSIWTVFALLLKPFFKWKIIVILDGISASTSFEDSEIRLFARRVMSSMTDAFVANSAAAAQYFIQVLNVAEAKVFHQTYIVPDSKALDSIDSHLSFDYQGLKILYIGRLVKRKGIRKLIEACLILKRQGLTDYTLILVGDGEERKALENFIEEAGLSHNVIFIGWLSYGQIGAYFRASDVFVLPSFEDTWGAVLLEAMAFGKPVICSKMAGASEIVFEGKNGFTFDPYDSSELAEKLSMFFKSPDLVEKMGCQAKAIVSDYSPKRTAAFFSELSTSLLSSPAI